jgi:hypothetical protein
MKGVGSVWARRVVTMAALGLAFAAMCAIHVATALGDAGNPIVGTIRGTIVPDASGPGMTVYVRGQWNWLSHNSDCNFDRAGIGVGIIWNDPNSPGYTVTKGSITAEVGVRSSTDGNAVDQMVHPADRGNVAQGHTAGTWTSTTQGYTTNTAGDYPRGQKFLDPSPANPNSYSSWKGGCGREPLSSTGPAGSSGLGAEGLNLACAGGGACAGHPWGSWGYETGGGLGYSHHYAARSDVTSVCANFYDVHGGGKFNSNTFQLVKDANEITVNANADNSIQTDSFSADQGANCVASSSIETVALTDVPLATAPTTAPTGGTAPNITRMLLKLTAAPADRVVVLRWQVRGGDEVSSFKIVRSPGRRGAALQVTPTHRATYVDRQVRNGVRYRYTLIATDAAGNVARDSLRVRPGPRLLAPLRAARVREPPLLQWTPVRGATYYNVQLYRGGEKILSAWPSRARLGLEKAWSFEHRRRGLSRGSYRWYVWPGFRSRAAHRYGRPIGSSTFVVVG